MADLCELWSWRPDDMEEMELDEFTEWRNRAVQRYNDRQKQQRQNV
ncbi:GpE family phage tail protein [Comamonas odontotermitis]